MRKYTVIAPLTLQAGVVVGLASGQAQARSHVLKTIRAADKKTGMGEYQLTESTQFKLGEVIWTDAAISKQLANALESPDETAARERAAATQKADAESLAQLRDKAAKWDAVQEELTASREFIAAIEQLPKDLLEQVKAALEKKSAATPSK